MDHMKQTIRLILARTFNRMTTYLAIFNFVMLCFWMYDNTGLGDLMKENSMRPGDMILISLFIIIAISAAEMIALGLEKKE